MSDLPVTVYRKLVREGKLEPIRKVAEFTRTVSGGNATKEEQERRIGICEGCQVVTKRGTGLYCKACKCPTWALSELRTKAKFRLAQCKLGKW